METSDPSIPPVPPAGPAAAGDLSLVALNQAYRRLRAQFLALLVTLVVLGGCLNIYLLRQVSLVRRDLTVNRPLAEKLMADYVRNGEPAIKQLLTKLEAFSRTHPDFRPILARYVREPNAQAPAPLPQSPRGK